jgi:hypothetical protein
MPTNIRAFDAAIGRHIERHVPQLIRDRTDAVAMSVHRGNIEETPVRSGRMKGNWQITVGGASPPSGAIEREDDTPKGTLGQAAFETEVGKLAGARDPRAIIWSHNGVPYAIHVNNGTPKQRAQRIIERVAARHRRMRGVL